MSFGREAMKKTLKQLKDSSILQFEGFEGIVKNINTRLERINEDLTDAMNKPIPKKIDCLSETARGFGRIIIDLNGGILNLLLAFISYISALENYSLEFDKTWDDLTKRTETAMKQVEEKTEQLGNKDLSYIK